MSERPMSDSVLARWNALYRFVNGHVYDGAPGVRSPDAECEYFRPKDIPNDGPRLSECRGDGHYLCRECENLTRTPDDDFYADEVSHG